MKKQQVFFALVTSFSSLTVGAAETIYDTDGFERTTSFNSGPVHSAQIVSSSAHELEVYLYPRNLSDSCHSASVYTDDAYIEQVMVDLVGGSRNVRSVKAQIPEALLTENKRVIAYCSDGENQEYYVHVLVPGAPVIDWQASVEPKGEFIYNSHSYGYHSSYNISSLLTVNNQNNAGYCYTVANREVELGLFHGRQGIGPFHSDVFVTNEQVDNSAEPQPVIYQVIECVNPSGKTKAVKVWELVNEEGINLVHDEIIIK